MAELASMSAADAATTEPITVRNVRTIMRKEASPQR
jgi:hypothetical protein